jgi:hypothetical protein
MDYGLIVAVINTRIVFVSRVLNALLQIVRIVGVRIQQMTILDFGLVLFVAVTLASSFSKRRKG